MKARLTDGRRVLSLFSGAGGLDLGFEEEGFETEELVEIEPWCVKTLRHNRPAWKVFGGDVRDYHPKAKNIDIILAGLPCQGFSLGGNRDEADERNMLYKEVVRITREAKPRVVVMENVLNLRTMFVPGSRRPFAEQIAGEFRELGYTVFFDIFKVCHYGVPQTRRRFVFVAFRGAAPEGYHFPAPGKVTTIRPFLYDLAQGRCDNLPNHKPAWGFKSAVHSETGQKFNSKEEVVPVRFSRTASDGNPIRSFDAPFPAVDTATVWGWAQGNVEAARFEKDRKAEKFIRNPNAKVTLWRVTASRLRTFTHREYARLQTFPDDWEFLGGNKRDIHLQIGNAVPVRFAAAIARNVALALDALENKRPFVEAAEAKASKEKA